MPVPLLCLSVVERAPPCPRGTAGGRKAEAGDQKSEGGDQKLEDKNLSEIRKAFEGRAMGVREEYRMFSMVRTVLGLEMEKKARPLRVVLLVLEENRALLVYNM